MTDIATTSPQEAPLATITGQQPTVGSPGQGNAVEGYRVSFQTRSGVQGFVFVAKAGYTEAAALEAVKKEATTLESLNGAVVN